MYITQVIPGEYMAKNTFFIRAVVSTAGDGTYAQTEIDLGSYTNLGSSKPEVLRIHNVQAGITDSTYELPAMNSDKGGTAAWQLTTQSQTALIGMSDDSFVSGGRMGGRNPDGSDQIPPGQTWEEQTLAQDWTAGSVIAVPSLFLGANSSAEWSEAVLFSVILECSTEAMSKSNAVSLAISQQ